MTELESELEAQLDALQQLEELKKEKEELLKQRDSNSPSQVVQLRAIHDANKKSLKSDVKKTSTFVKKMRAITQEGKESHRYHRYQNY